MTPSNWKRNSFVSTFILIGLFGFFLLGRSAPAQGQVNRAEARLVRALEEEQTRVANPAGLAFSPRAQSLHVVEAPAVGVAATAELNRLNGFGDPVGSAQIAALIHDPINMTFDAHFNRLLVYRPSGRRLVAVGGTPAGGLDTRRLSFHDARQLGVEDAAGIAVAPDSGALFILDAAGARLVRVQPDAAGAFGAASVSAIDLPAAMRGDVRGLAVDPRSGHLHVLSLAQQAVYELTHGGEIVAVRELAGVTLRNPQGMVFAPSGDLTDAPSLLNLYIADSGRDSSPAGEAALPGQILEITLDDPVQIAATTTEAILIRTFDTSQFDPPSPDPSGIAFRPTSGRLLISDGEVNEMPIYEGFNLFESTLSGSLVNTFTTTSFSDEPTGLEYNPVNGHLFVSDDTGTRAIYELDPGPDGQLHTGDDIVTMLRTATFESRDPEGVTYDPASGHLFIIDGANREVYRVSPGANGVFDGAPPAGDDQVSHFDTLDLGLDDPEGIVFNPTTGYLYAVGRPADTVFELTVDGALVQTIDISAANARKPAGLALAPGSQNPADLNLYVVARGVDNDSDPNENDGKVHELWLGDTVGTPVPTATTGPTATATPTATNTPTSTPTNTPTTGPTPTATATGTNTPTATNTPTPTNTPVTSQLVLPAVADARVLQSNPNTNYGTLTRLDIDVGEHSYIRFNVTGVSGAITSARMRLFVANGSSNGPGIYGTSNDWSETGITWNNGPAATTGAIANAGQILADSWAEYDVTTYVQGNGSYSFVFLPDGSDGVRFNSRERSLPPELILTFATGPTPTATNTPVPTNTPTATHTATPTSTPTTGPTPTATNTPVPTNTPTAISTATNTATPTSTPTTGPTPTATNTPLPTNTPPAVSTLTLLPVADAPVFENQPNSNGGPLRRLYMDAGEQSYLRFDVAGVSGAIQSANLRLFVTNGSTNGPAVYGTDNSWTETGITWNNRPAPTTPVLANVGNAPSESWVVYDVTGYVTGNGAYSFVVVADSTDGMTTRSREGSPPPELVLTFGSGPAATATPSSTPPPTGTPSSDSVVFVGAGDIARCSSLQDDLTAQLLDNIPGYVFTIGDNANPNGSASDYANCYEPTWGRHKARTRPALGDNDYGTAGAAAAFAYFGAAVGAPGQGYYSYNAGAWHIVVLNSNCSQVGGCSPGSPQGQWLQADLAANPATCTLAIFHEPLFSSNGGDDDLRDFWAMLYSAGADIVLNGHRHYYERFALQNPDGVADPGRGIRQFTVGTGGDSLSSIDSNPANLQARNNTTHGVLKLTLHPAGYDWEFVPVPGQTFTDSGSDTCVIP